jgi:MFS family permease
MLIGRFGPLPVLVSGQLIIAAALTMLAVGPTGANYVINLMFPLGLIGLGGGLSFPSLTMIAMADAAPDDAGLASGILNTTGQVGGALGLAVLATVAASHSIALLHNGAEASVALAGGYHFAWFVGAATVLVTLAIAVVMLRTPRSVVGAECEPVECVA